MLYICIVASDRSHCRRSVTISKIQHYMQMTLMPRAPSLVGEDDDFIYYDSNLNHPEFLSFNLQIKQLKPIIMKTIKPMTTSENTFNRGYFRVSRSLFRSELWLKKRVFSRLEAMIWLLEQAAYVEGRRVRLARGTVTLQRGQLVTTLQMLADRWCWSKSKVARFLAELERNRSIEEGLQISVSTIYITDETSNDTLSGTHRVSRATCITICGEMFDVAFGDSSDTADKPQEETKDETPVYRIENKDGKESSSKHTHTVKINSEGVVGGDDAAQRNKTAQPTPAAEQGEKKAEGTDSVAEKVSGQVARPAGSEIRPAVKPSRAELLVEWVRAYFPQLAAMKSPLTVGQAERLLGLYHADDIKYIIACMQSKEAFRNNSFFYSTFMTFARRDNTIMSLREPRSSRVR